MNTCRMCDDAATGRGSYPDHCNRCALDLASGGLSEVLRTVKESARLFGWGFVYGLKLKAAGNPAPLLALPVESRCHSTLDPSYFHGPEVKATCGVCGIARAALNVGWGIDEWGRRVRYYRCLVCSSKVTALYYSDAPRARNFGHVPWEMGPGANWYDRAICEMIAAREELYGQFPADFFPPVFEEDDGGWEEEDDWDMREDDRDWESEVDYDFYHAQYDDDPSPYAGNYSEE